MRAMDVVMRIIAALALTVGSVECVRVLQLAGYRPERGYAKVLFSPCYILSLFVQGGAVALDLIFRWGGYVSVGLYAVYAVALCCIRRKTPLHITKRAVRLFMAEGAILCVLCVFVCCTWWLWLLPVIVLLAWLITLPVEYAIGEYYIRRAQHKLSDSGVTVIAVTGSYGKTSVKDMLATLLDDCLCPEGSCNTPLGIAAYINRTQLNKRYLVLEFGARRRKDIARLCRLYSPRYGIVTGVCAQHLATFGSLENVIAAKRELVECLPENGLCVLNAADEIARGYMQSGQCDKILSDAVHIERQSVDLDGTQLVVHWEGTHSVVHLPQISDYIVDTFAICITLTLGLGQSLNRTLARVPYIRQTPHRMEVRRADGFHIVDDSYNAGEAGVLSCCKTLDVFDCPKAVITQGIVECGKARRNMNVSCGRLLGGSCDVAVVLGRNARYLREGLESVHCRVLSARSLDEAVRLAVPFAMGGLLLFQNDLPDSVGLN